MDSLGSLSGAGHPFLEGGLYEGRSVHYLSRTFYSRVMQHDLNERGRKLPKWQEVSAALKRISADDERHIQMLLDLVATPLTNLWPGFENPPPTSEGILWFAASKLKEHLPLLQDDATGVTPDWVANDSTQMEEEVVFDQSRKKRVGRKRGSKRYTSSQIDNLLDAVEEILPCGRNMWEAVSLRCNDKDKGCIRNGESCKIKFHKMAFAKKPTGQSEIPIQIRRAKNIKELIDAQEVIGMVDGNRSNSEDENGGERSGDSDISSTRRALQGANLSQGDGEEVRRPVTKKQHGFYMVEALDRLTESNRDSASQIQSAIRDMNDGGGSNASNHQLSETVETMKKSLRW